MDQSPARRAVEDRSRARVYAAKLRFDLAVAQLEQAIRECGASGAEHAMMLEAQAREEYQRELEIFAGLIVRGEDPASHLPNAHAPEAHPGPAIAE